MNKLQILNDLKHHLQKNFKGTIKDVILFGSQATGNIKMDSDFDILIVLEEDYTGRDENTILDLCFDIDLKYNIVIDAHLISSSEIKSLRGKQPIYYNALNNGVYA
ncbi:MAG: nucleotidyltransferase domain-containing protein [Bacteroidetes bacterium]|nr:nucleotidyltransferase domain-containing protein [Bacteroidota bacterium]